jgi:hypothetical protein
MVGDHFEDKGFKTTLYFFRLCDWGPPLHHPFETCYDIIVVNESQLNDLFYKPSYFPFPYLGY